MPTYRTSVGPNFSHKEISFTLSDDAHLDPEWLIAFFEHSIKTGKRFQPDQTVQIGWMITTLRNSSTGDLEVWEPQFDSFPIKWTNGVNNTLRHLILQKTIASLIDSPPSFPSLAHAGMVSSAFLVNNEEFAMERSAVSGNVSGWYFADAKAKHPESNLMSLFEVSFHCMRVIPYLALPPGSAISRFRDCTEIRFGKRIVRSSENEVLARITEAEILV